MHRTQQNLRSCLLIFITTINIYYYVESFQNLHYLNYRHRRFHHRHHHVMGWNNKKEYGSNKIILYTPVYSSSSSSHHTTYTDDAKTKQQQKQQQSKNEEEFYYNTCNFCKQQFTSRNALFRHLRSNNNNNNKCAGNNLDDDNTSHHHHHQTKKKRKVIIRFGYYVKKISSSSLKEEEEGNYHTKRRKKKIIIAPITTTKNQNEIAADIIKESFFQVLLNKTKTKQQQQQQQQQPVTIELVAVGNNNEHISQSSVARHRHPCLSQDYDCSSSSDFICINYKDNNNKSDDDSEEDGDEFASFSSSSSSSSSSILQNSITSLLHSNNNKEKKIVLDHHQHHHHDHHHNQYNMLLKDIHVIDVKEIPTSSNFQAEQSCTQRIYHYVLPLDWLEEGGGRKIQEWWKLQEQQQQRQQKQDQQQKKRTHQPRGSLARPPEMLIRLKRALKLFESSNIQHGNETQHGGGSSSKKRSSPGRFGSMWTKERRCWHNFADPSLGGMASPSNDPVWRVVDKCRLVEIITTTNNITTGNNSSSNSNDDGRCSVAAVIEIKGDGFVTQQIRRIIGSAIAIANEWLPPDFAKIATRSDVCIETPIAPSGRLYFAGARFHFIELITQGSSSSSSSVLFKEETEASQIWQKQLQSYMLYDTGTDPITYKAEQGWLKELKNTTVPRIRKQLEKLATEDKIRSRQQQKLMTTHLNNQNHKKTGGLLQENKYNIPAPVPYNRTLSLLREIVENGKWPRTSRARSRVIRGSSSTGTTADISRNLQTTKGGRTGVTDSIFNGEMLQSGSFTVINNKILDEEGKVPLGNELFPNLAKSVFELESQIADLIPRVGKGIDGQPRPPSTHCAINRNAEFVPHVDSGRGQGQSVSMIVGLGDFEGGSIYVEGEPYNIRYQPLEFDGWKQRHWTQPFQGERYSLVWFTPAGSSSTVDDTTYPRKEENMVKELVVKHQAKLPDYAPLKYRRDSTDELVINEILDTEKGCIYELRNHVWEGTNETHDFTVKGHCCVLDIGAHIGIFSRYALSMGCQEVIAFEPEPRNFKLLRHNLRQIHFKNTTNRTDRTKIHVHEVAVAMGKPGSRFLVHARNRNDGTLNTWRHALEEYTRYVDKTTKLPSGEQMGKLNRSTVSTIPFFGVDGALSSGVTFVKLDCEGSEIDILLSIEATKPESWLDVTHLVFEWSFTKEKRVAIFHNVIHNLKRAGFDNIYYEGKGAWWEEAEMWPFHNDLVVYALRKSNDLVQRQ